jgi:hypothetical protein
MMGLGEGDGDGLGDGEMCVYRTTMRLVRYTTTVATTLTVGPGRGTVRTCTTSDGDG